MTGEPMNNKTPYLLPASSRLPGAVLVLAGIFLLTLKYAFDFKPHFLEMKMFAFYTYYIEAKSFSIIKHQMIEEFGGVLLLAGLFMVAFSREKIENEWTRRLRLKSFMITAWFFLVYLLVSVLFFYGFGFVGALTFSVITWLVCYILVFRFNYSRHTVEDVPVPGD